MFIFIVYWCSSPSSAMMTSGVEHLFAWELKSEFHMYRYLSSMSCQTLSVVFDLSHLLNFGTES